MNPKEIHQQIQSALAGGKTAIRGSLKLSPAGGDGDKVFPPTYEGGQYAKEQRLIDGNLEETVLLDSVQSQANRMELALLEARNNERIKIPLISVDFNEFPSVSCLEAPHRIYDAIFRDSYDGQTLFRQSELGRTILNSTVQNAAGLLRYAPNILVFGGWDSHGERGGSGNKVPRALVSEIVGVNAVPGIRPTSRIDPLGIELRAAEIYVSTDPEKRWTITEEDAVLDKHGRPKKVGADGKPTEIGHSNIVPSWKNDRNEPNHGGVTIRYALQTSVLSLPQIRRLRFPDESGDSSVERDIAGRTLTVAYGLCSLVLQSEQGFDLRSRCLLVPQSEMMLEFVGRVLEDVQSFLISPDDVCELLSIAADKAKEVGLAWETSEKMLQARPDLIELVRRSRAPRAIGS